MAYYPQTYLDQPGPLPKAIIHADDADLSLALRVLTEKWHRFYPPLAYYQLDFEVTGVDEPSTELSGELPGTKVDPLWGGPMPPTPDDHWHNPHGQDAIGTPLNPTTAKKYKDVVNLPIYVLKNPTDYTLSRYGIRNKRQMIATIPLIVCDQYQVTLRVGDHFIWDGEKWEVLVVHEKMPWKRTNYFLYAVLETQRLVEGS